jgi:hypothetical protein
MDFANYIFNNGFIYIILRLKGMVRHRVGQSSNLEALEDI